MPFARPGMAVTAVDPEPEMLAAAEAAARGGGRDDRPAAGRLVRPAARHGAFRLVTMGRAFHWMDRAATLATAGPHRHADGAVAFVSRCPSRTAENRWFTALLRGDRKPFGRGAAPHIAERKSGGHRRYESFLFDSRLHRARAARRDRPSRDRHRRHRRPRLLALHHLAAEAGRQARSVRSRNCAAAWRSFRRTAASPRSRRWSALVAAAARNGRIAAQARFE